jgi:hypothetical protein
VTNTENSFEILKHIERKEQAINQTKKARISLASGCIQIPADNDAALNLLANRSRKES